MHGHSIKEVDPFACHINKSFVGRAKKGEVFPYRHYGKKKFGWNFWTSTKKKVNSKRNPTCVTKRKMISQHPRDIWAALL